MRAAYRFIKEGNYGAKTVLDIPPLLVHKIGCRVESRITVRRFNEENNIFAMKYKKSTFW
ncbi:MAG: hypothetical protein ACLSCV_08780 [Acutalibacteraceae bacterium]